jgi:hypothetical protein
MESIKNLQTGIFLAGSGTGAVRHWGRNFHVMKVFGAHNGATGPGHTEVTHTEVTR